MSVTLQLEQMSTKEKITIMESLWDSLCQKSEDITSPDWHFQILNQREKDLKKGNDSFTDWEEAKINIRKSIE